MSVSITSAPMDCLYVIAFSNGFIKVGRTNDPIGRVKSHRDRVACMGVKQVDVVHFICEDNVQAREAWLIAECASRATERHQNEWFTGLEFEEVRALAERAAYEVQIPAAPTTAGGVDFKAIVSSLKLAGYTQWDIASICGITQSSVSDIATGKTVDPSYSVGAALIRAHAALAAETEG